MDLTQQQEELASQIGEDNGVKDTLLELLLHNKLAVFSAIACPAPAPSTSWAPTSWAATCSAASSTAPG